MKTFLTTLKIAADVTLIALCPPWDTCRILGVVKVYGWEFETEE